jgi:hypothetical protein
MASLERMQMAVSQDFKYRVEYMLYWLADYVISEDPTSENHTQKMAVARKILNGQINVSDFTKLVVTDNALGTKIDNAEALTDADIRSAVQSRLLIMAKGAI